MIYDDNSEAHEDRREMSQVPVIECEGSTEKVLQRITVTGCDESEKRYRLRVLRVKQRSAVVVNSAEGREIGCGDSYDEGVTGI